MSLQNIDNGAFDNDANADKVRIAFQKVKEMFEEIYTQIPFEDSDMVGNTGKFLRVNAGETALEYASISGGGDMLASNNLSDVSSVTQARTNLGLGSAAIRAFIDEDSFVSDSATSVPSQQSVKAYVDAQVLDYQAGTGITIQTTSPYSAAAPGIIATNVSNNVESAAFAPSTGILTLTLETGTVTVDLSAYTVLKIDGYEVKKGSGNVDYEAIEVGDYASGWESDEFVAFKVDALPYATAGNRSFAIKNSI